MVVNVLIAVKDNFGFVAKKTQADYVCVHKVNILDLYIFERN